MTFLTGKKPMTDEIIITQPDDWHLHLRDGSAMVDVVNHTAERFARAIVMPNLKPPIVNTVMAMRYRERILAALPLGSDFDPLMTLYLTDETPPDEIDRAKTSGVVQAVKLYPAGATTNSDSGVTDIRKVYPVLERMQRLDVSLLVHGESTEPEVDVFDRERRFIDERLLRILRDFPGLRVVFEHITTREAVGVVRSGPSTLAATITAHHLLYNRGAMYAGGLRTHLYCLPILKRKVHQRALVEAAISGNPRFFLGSDSAPHARSAKESACGCAGIYTAHAGIELYAEAFDRAGALHRLEGFASHYGADFYGLPRNTRKIRLVRDPWRVPVSYPFGDQELIPLRAGEMVEWKIVD